MNSYDLNSIIQNQIDINKRALKSTESVPVMNSIDLETYNHKIEKRENTFKEDVEMNIHMKSQIKSIESTLEEQGRMLIYKMITRCLTDL